MRAPLLILLATLGCGSDLLGPDFDRRLTLMGGCGDVIFYAVDPDDEVMVTFRADGLVAAALEAGAETSTLVDLPADDVDLMVEQGSHISDATCDDVIENSGPRVRRSWSLTPHQTRLPSRPIPSTLDLSQVLEAMPPFLMVKPQHPPSRFRHRTHPRHRCHRPAAR